MDNNKITNKHFTNNRLRYINTGFFFLIIVSIWFALIHVNINSNLDQFLPQNKQNKAINNSTDSNEAFVDSSDIISTVNQANSQLLLLAIEGGDTLQRAAASKKIRKELLVNNDFSFVNNGNRHLLKKETQLLMQYRYLLSSNMDTADSFSVARLKSQLHLGYTELLSPLGGHFKNTFRNDPTDEYRHILKQWGSVKEPTNKHSVWFSQDLRQAILVVGLAISDLDINQQEKIIEKINTIFASINVDNLTLRMSGAGVFALDARQTIQAETKSLTLFATLAIILFLMLAFRSVWLTLVAGLPLLTAILAGMIVTQLSFGSIHGITLAFGITLIGVALDYPVHFFSHLNKHSSPAQVVREIWPTMRLGFITTCFGYLALTQTNFDGLAQLGVFASAGLLSAAMTTRYILPNLIPAQIRIMSAFNNHWYKKIDSIPVSMSRWIGLAILMLTSVMFYFYPIQWENNLSRLSPMPIEQLKLDKFLRAQLQAEDISNVAVISASSSNSALVKSEQFSLFLNKLIEKKIISGYRSASQFLPSKDLQLIRQKNLPESSVLNFRLGSVLQNMTFKPGIFKPFITDIEQAKDLNPLTLDKAKGTIIGKQISSLLFNNEDQWLALVRFKDVKNNADLMEHLKAYPDRDISILNIKKTTQNVIDNFRDEAIKLILIGLVIIFLILLAGLRDLLSLVRVTFITAMTLSSTILLLNMLGESLSLFHLVSLLLVLGLGLDYSLFFNRKTESGQQRLRTYYGVAICFGSTTLVFGMLATSSIPVLRAIGLTVTLGVIFSFLYANLFSDKATQPVTKPQ